MGFGPHDSRGQGHAFEAWSCSHTTSDSPFLLAGGARFSRSTPRIPGDHKLLAIPVPIPNTVVKQGLPMILLKRESRSSPGFSSEASGSSRRLLSFPDHLRRPGHPGSARPERVHQARAPSACTRRVHRARAPSACTKRVHRPVGQPQADPIQGTLPRGPPAGRGGPTGPGFPSLEPAEGSQRVPGPRG